MHACPVCGWDCDCDDEDTWTDDPQRCNHPCEEDPEDDHFERDDDDDPTRR